MRILKNNKSPFWNLNNSIKPNFKNQEDWDSFLREWFEETEIFKVTDKLNKEITLSNVLPQIPIEPNDLTYRFIELPLIIETEGKFYYLDYPYADNKTGKNIGIYKIDIWLTFWNKVDFSGLINVEEMSLPDNEKFYSRNLDLGNTSMIISDTAKLKLRVNNIGFIKGQEPITREPIDTYESVLYLMDQKWVLFFTNKIKDSSQQVEIINETGNFYMPYSIIAVPMLNNKVKITNNYDGTYKTENYNLEVINDVLMDQFGNDIEKVVVVNYLPINNMKTDLNETKDSITIDSGGNVLLLEGHNFFNFVLDNNYESTGKYKPVVLRMKTWSNVNNPIEVIYDRSKIKGKNMSFNDYFNGNLPNWKRGLTKISIIKANVPPVEIDKTKINNDFSRDLFVKSLIGDQLQGDEFLIKNSYSEFEAYRNNRLIFTYLNEAPLNFDAWKTYQSTNRWNIGANFANLGIGAMASVLGGFGQVPIPDSKNTKFGFKGGGIPLAIGAKTATSAINTIAQRKTIKRSPDNITNSNVDFFLNMFFGNIENEYTLVLEEPIDTLRLSLYEYYKNNGIEINNFIKVDKEMLNNNKYHNYIKTTSLMNILNGFPQEVINYFVELFNAGVKLVHYQSDTKDFKIFS